MSDRVIFVTPSYRAASCDIARPRVFLHAYLYDKYKRSREPAELLEISRDEYFSEKKISGDGCSPRPILLDFSPRTRFN